MVDPLRFGGQPLLTLRAEDAPAQGPAFVEADVLPGRGMMLLQARLRLPSGELFDAINAPSPAEAAAAFGGENDFVGNLAFSFGGAILAPYANRIRGKALEDAREIETEVEGRTMRLPRNWGGKAKGAEQYAMHGLILDAAVPFAQPRADLVQGRLSAGDFTGRWPSRAELGFEWRLEGGALFLKVTVRNVGGEVLPMGVGWHPYFNLPSGDRRQARLRLPAARRMEVNDYDEVLPTGRLLETAGTPYDFSGPQGAALGDLYLDDCFTDLVREDGRAVIDILDPKAGVGLRIGSKSPQVKAVQVYAPPEKAFVVVEPQFNLADPFGAAWPDGVDTGMARLKPGHELSYDVRLEAFALGT